MRIVYHVFADNRDDWFDTYLEALRAFYQLVGEYGSARLYREVWADNDEADEPVEEDCLRAVGGYPY